MKPFSEKLAALRMQLGMSQRQLAEALGISHQYLGHIESGYRRPSVQMVDALCARCDPHARHQWHAAGARAHGWDV